MIGAGILIVIKQGDPVTWLIGILTSIPLLAGSARWRTIHFVTNVGGYLLLLITIALGVLLALG